MTEKIIGYLLLAIGIITILFSGFSVYNVFTKQSKPVQLFNFKGIGFDTSQILSGALPPEFANQIPKNSKAAQTELIPPDLLNDSSNIFAHLMLMGFLASVGAKIAGIGTQLVRPIVVKLKAKDETPTNSANQAVK